MGDSRSNDFATCFGRGFMRRLLRHEYYSSRSSNRSGTRAFFRYAFTGSGVPRKRPETRTLDDANDRGYVPDPPRTGGTLWRHRAARSEESDHGPPPRRPPPPLPDHRGRPSPAAGTARHYAPPDQWWIAAPSRGRAQTHPKLL